LGWIIQAKKDPSMGNNANNDRNPSGAQSGSIKHCQQDQSHLRQQPSQQNQQTQNKNDNDSTESNQQGNKTGRQNTEGGGQSGGQSGQHR
jgi:hypothetical protein